MPRGTFAEKVRFIPGVWIARSNWERRFVSAAAVLNRRSLSSGRAFKQATRRVFDAKHPKTLLLSPDNESGMTR